MTSPMTISGFRTAYPEFTDTGRFPNGTVQYWLNTAYLMLNAGRWGRQLDIAAALYCAHNLVLEARAVADTAVGGLPGTNIGPISSKSVDKVSVSNDVNVATEEGAGHWNMTIYGTRLHRLIKLFGAGPIQLGIGCVPPLSGPGWSGPDCSPGPTNFGS